MWCLKSLSLESSLYISSNNSWSKSSHFSNAYSFRNTPGEMLRAMRAASTSRVPLPHIGSMKSVSPCHPVISIIPAANTSLRGASTLSCRYPRLCSDSPLESSDNVALSSAICILSRMSGFVTEMFGRLPVCSRNWSTMASLTLYVTKRELRNSSEYTTESTENVLPSPMYWLQSIFLTSSYMSSAERALKWAIGFSILMAVCNWKFARYNISLLPVNDTIRLPVCMLFAPRSVSSFARTFSSPMKVLAIISNSCPMVEF